jgi:hypothetical protein
VSVFTSWRADIHPCGAIIAAVAALPLTLHDIYEGWSTCHGAYRR